MTFNITILGTNAALPGPDTITTSVIARARDQYYLFDCGEGMQSKMMTYGFRRNRIFAIFISHLHGDHLFGLPGLLTSYAHFQRPIPLHVIGPKGIREFIEKIFSLTYAYTNFELHITELEHQGSQCVYEDNQVKVHAFPLKHRVPTYGYRLTEKPRTQNLIKEKLDEYKVTVDQITDIMTGRDIQFQGQTISYQEFTYTKSSPRSFAFCTDTVYDEDIIPYIKNVDILYHEATYMASLKEKAEQYSHSTAAQAAQIARLAEAKKLVLGHFSTRYEVKDAFKADAEEFFTPVVIAREGLQIEVD